MWMYTRRASEQVAENRVNIVENKANVNDAWRTEGVRENIHRAENNVNHGADELSMNAVMPVQNTERQMVRDRDNFMSQMDGDGWWEQESVAEGRRCPTCGARI